MLKLSSAKRRFDFIPPPADFGDGRPSRATFRPSGKVGALNSANCFKVLNYAAGMLPGEKGASRTRVFEKSVVLSSVLTSDGHPSDPPRSLRDTT